MSDAPKTADIAKKQGQKHDALELDQTDLDQLVGGLDAGGNTPICPPPRPRPGQPPPKV